MAPGTAPSSASVLPQLAVLRPGGCPPQEGAEPRGQDGAGRQQLPRPTLPSLVWAARPARGREPALPVAWPLLQHWGHRSAGPQSGCLHPASAGPGAPCPISVARGNCTPRGGVPRPGSYPLSSVSACESHCPPTLEGDSGDSGGSGWHSVTVVAAVRPQCICPRRFPSGRERAEKTPVTLPLAPNTSGSHLGEASQLVSVAPRRRSVSSLRSTVLRGAAARGGEVSHSFSRPRLDGNPHPAPGRRGRGTNRDAVGKTHRAAPSANEASSPRTVCGARGKASGPFYP